MYKVREANRNDCYGIGKVYCESWKTAYKNLLPQEYLDSLCVENCMSDTISENELVLEKQDEIVGVCHVAGARNRDSSSWGEVVSIYLLAELWGSGAGRELLRAALNKLRQRNLNKVCLWVLRDNTRARKFYEKNGFQISRNKREIEIAGCRVSEVEYIYYG